jgi:hypothetical protein
MEMEFGVEASRSSAASSSSRYPTKRVLVDFQFWTIVKEKRDQNREEKEEKRKRMKNGPGTQLTFDNGQSRFHGRLKSTKL